MLDAFSAPYMQRALLEVLLLSVPAGVLGSWIVLRRLAFFTHAVGTVTFPGLVVAGPWGVAPPLAALGAALGFGVAQERLARSRRLAPDAATGLLLVAALALGVVLASDVYESGAGVDTLLFGTLIGLSAADVWLTRRWRVGALGAGRGAAAPLARGGVRAGQRAGARACARAAADRLLLVGIAAAAVVALDAVGALLVAVVLVVPAATARLLCTRLAPMQVAATALAARGGRRRAVVGRPLNVAPGPAWRCSAAACSPPSRCGRGGRAAG